MPHAEDRTTSDHGAIDLSGTWLAAPADDELRRDAVDAAFDDSAWVPVDVPGRWAASADLADAGGPVLHRRRFATPGSTATSDDQRAWLVFDRIVYNADVWLDGGYVGDVEGAFAPHAFDVTEQLATRDEHALAVEVACAHPQDPRSQRQLTGALQSGRLLEPGPNPGGIWGPVRLERSGPVRITSHRVLSSGADEHSARLSFRTVLDAAEATEATVRTTVQGATHEHPQPIAAGRNVVTWTIDVPDPELWWPWSLGDQPLVDVVTSVVLGDGRTSDSAVRRVGLRDVAWRDWELRVNGQRVFLKGANLLPSRTGADDAEADRAAGDVAFARDIGLDLLRVHAHVAHPSLYDAADELGVLLWQDLPLQGGYHRSVRRQARRQAEQAVDLLGHHASVAVWCAHDSPVAPDVAPDDGPSRGGRGRALAGHLLPTWNKTVLDHALTSVLERSDGTRPVVPHAGVLPHRPHLDGSATALLVGWHHGDERDLPTVLRRWPRLGRFVGSFGAQALADAAEPDQPPAAGAGPEPLLERAPLERHVPRHAFADRAAWVRATQRYQALLVRHQTEELRRVRFAPCGGFALLALADADPGGGFGIVDEARRPKRASTAMADACAPVIVVVDRPAALLEPGQVVRLDVHVVSDRRDALVGAITTATASWQPAASRPTTPPWLELAIAEQDGGDPSSAPSGAAALAAQTWRWGGDVPADACVRVGVVELVVPAEAAGHLLVLDLRLEGADVVATNRCAARVRSPVEAGGTV